MYLIPIISRILLCYLFSPVLSSLATSNTSEENAPRTYMWAAFYLQDLEQLELEFVQNLTRFKTQDTNVTQQVESYFRDFVIGSGLNSLADVNNIQETQAWKNPVCGYRLIDRTSGILKSLVSNKAFNESFDTAPVRSYFEKYGWPSSSDIKDAANAIIRLQQVYNFAAESLSVGVINSTKTPCSFNSHHCLEIAKIAMETDYLALAIDWLEVAKTKVASDKKVDPDFIHETLWNAIEEHNKVVVAMKGKSDDQLFARRISHAPGNSKTAPKVRDVVSRKNAKTRHAGHEDTCYWSLCSGNNHQTEDVKAKLFCWLESKIHPLLTIRPTKMEFLSINPDVVQIYDVLTASEIAWFTSDWFKSARLYSAKTSPSEGGHYDEPGHRTSSYAHISDDDIHAIAFKTKVQIITGFPALPDMCTRVIRSQITSYSFGGHFAPHQDQLDWTEDNQDEILATFAIYLNDIEMGGATAFTTLGFAAQPIPGSAVLWYSGYKKSIMRHAGCPIVLGEKWLATKWMTTRDMSEIPKWNTNPRAVNKQRKRRGYKLF